MDEVLMIKIIFIFCMLLSAGFFGFLPLISPSFHKNENYLSIGNCFAAGIFIIVGLAGLLPDAQASLSEDLSSDIPLAYVLAACGYMTILFVENVLFSHSHDISHSHLDQHLANADLSINVESDFKPSHKSLSLHKHDELNAVLPGAILTAALVIHSIFEGIALGLISSKSSTITLAVAVLIHNIPAAIALGIKIQRVRRWVYFLLMGMFVVASPFSTMMGILISGSGAPGVEGVFLSFSAGTFIYIGCSEILPEEMEKEFSKVVKFAAFVLGVLPMSAFFLLVPED
jgi:solute carrier family 39 (zinc transporter), member 1/2/3